MANAWQKQAAGTVTGFTSHLRLILPAYAFSHTSGTFLCLLPDFYQDQATAL